MQIASFEKLEVLDVRNVYLTDKSIEAIAKLPALSQLLVGKDKENKLKEAFALFDADRKQKGWKKITVVDSN